MFLILVLLAMPAMAHAQTNYCDTLPQNFGTAVAGSAATIHLCDSLLDTNGNLTTISGWALYTQIGTGPVVRTTPTFTQGTKSAVTGLWDFSSPITVPTTPGVTTYQVAAINTFGEGAKSAPFALTVTLPATVPAAPTNVTVK
jgi:hypothetical protein